MFYFVLILLLGACLIFWSNFDWAWERLTLNDILKRKLNFRLAGLPFGDITTVTLVAMFGTAVLSPLYWEFPLHTVVSVGKDGTIRDSSDFFGVPDVPWSNRTTVNLSYQSYRAIIAVQPVTANPKVRHIVSHVWARITDTQKYLRAVPEAAQQEGWGCGSCNSRRGGDGISIFTKQIESAIYEFHEKHSVELGWFYNPHDAAQQEKFYQLAIGAIASDLAKKGIEVTGAEFSM